MKNIFKFLLLFLLCKIDAVPGTPPSKPTPAPLKEMVMGQENAPVTIIEYTSLTCDHCAEFQAKTLPLLKKNYIDKGLVKLVFREFPSDGWALRAFAIARCAPEKDFFPLIEYFFETQKEWLFAKDYNKELAKIARKFGLKRDQVNACFANDVLLESIVAVRVQGVKKFKINRTPWFIIDGNSYPWALTFEEIDKILRSLVAAAS